MPARRMLPFILINVVISAVVSAVVLLSILYFWENQRPETGQVGLATAVADQPAFATPTSPFVSEPTPTATPEPEGPPIHVVNAGETLATIAQTYSVPIDDIVVANNLANPNLLSIGDQLLIPVGGLPTATPPPTIEPTASVLPSPIATEPIDVAPPEEAIVTITAVIAPGDIANEAVQLINEGGSPVALLNWKVVDTELRYYTFKQVTLFGDGAAILLHSTTGRDTATDIYWGQATAVWQPGELVTLLDGDDNIIATFIVPDQE